MRVKKAQYTHFASVPFIRKTQRDSIAAYLRMASDILLDAYQKRNVMENSVNLMHLTLVMLTLDTNQLKEKATKVLDSRRDFFKKELAGTKLFFPKLGYFTRYNHKLQYEEVSVIYLKVQGNQQLKKIEQTFDTLMHDFIAENVINEEDLGDLRVIHDQKTDTYTNGGYHVTLFRLRNIRENEHFQVIFQKLNNNFKPIQCQCDTLDISTRGSYDETAFYRPLARIILTQ